MKLEFAPNPEYLIVNERNSEVILSTRNWDELVRIVEVLEKAGAEFTIFVEMKR